MGEEEWLQPLASLSSVPYTSLQGLREVSVAGWGPAVLSSALRTGFGDAMAKAKRMKWREGR